MVEDTAKPHFNKLIGEGLSVTHEYLLNKKLHNFHRFILII